MSTRYEKAGVGYRVSEDGAVVGSVMKSGHGWWFSPDPSPSRKWLGGHSRQVAVEALLRHNEVLATRKDQR